MLGEDVVLAGFGLLLVVLIIAPVTWVSTVPIPGIPIALSAIHIPKRAFSRSVIVGLGFFPCIEFRDCDPSSIAGLFQVTTVELTLRR